MSSCLFLAMDLSFTLRATSISVPLPYRLTISLQHLGSYNSNYSFPTLFSTTLTLLLVNFSSNFTMHQVLANYLPTFSLPQYPGLSLRWLKAINKFKSYIYKSNRILDVHILLFPSDRLRLYLFCIRLWQMM